VGYILKDQNFPADKQTIVTFVEKLKAPQTKEIRPLIEKLYEKRYEISEIAITTGLVE
jgi:hypothetical protein